jgi:hypothetical protein
MNNKDLAQYIGVPIEKVDYVLSMSGAEIVKDEIFVGMLKSVDRDLLERTLPQAREAYEKGLPAFETMLQKRYGLSNTPMSAYTLGNWVVGALQFPDYIDTILNMHADIASEVFVGGLPDLLDMVANVPDGGHEWQRALCIFSIPLMRAGA